MKRAFAFGTAFLLAPLSALAHPVWTPGEQIVPLCSNLPHCQLCDLVHLANHLTSFAVYFSVIVATLLFTYAGILYVTAAADQGRLEKAKKLFWSIFLGLVIVLSAWLVVNVVLSVFTGSGVAFWTKDAGTCTAAQSAKPVTAGTVLTDSDFKDPGGTENVQRVTLGACGVGVNKLAPDTTIAGVDQETIAAICKYKKDCDQSVGKICEVTVTGGSESGHKNGTAPGSHGAGDKVDVSSSESVKAYIANRVALGEFTEIKNPSFGTRQYVDNATGAIWTLEDEGTRSEHYDVCIKNCSAPGATGG